MGWGAVADFASSALDVGGKAFSSAASFAGDAFGWLGENAEAANVLGGVAMGVGQYYSDERDRDQRAEQARLDRQMQRDLQAEQLQAQQIAPGDMGAGYGSYRDNVTQGLISNGMLASNGDQS